MLAIGKVLAAAKEIADVDDRVAFVEEHFALVDRPAELVETWIDACHSNESLEQEEILARVRDLATRYAMSPGFLSQLGKQLDYFDYPEACIAILEAAVARDDATDQAYEALGRLLLVRRGDPRGIVLVEQARVLDPDWDKPRVTLAAHFLARDPAHAMVLLGDSGDTYACELRSILLAAMGNDEGAIVELDEALSHYPTLVEARRALCMWHYDERRFARSREHASALLALPHEDIEHGDRTRIESAIVSAYRMGGNFAELVPWLQERCKHEVPADLAEDIFFGLTSQHPTPDFALALRAAQTTLENVEHDDDVVRLRVQIGELHARERDDFTCLDELADTLADSTVGWAQLAHAYFVVGHYAAATACADRLVQIDPDSTDALDAHGAIALAVGDSKSLHRLACALASKTPDTHDGYELLARSHARRDEPAEAVANARRAVELDPHCHVAWLALGEACLVAGDLPSATDAVERSHAIEAAVPGDDLAVVRAALARDPGALEAVLGLRYRHLAALPFPDFVEKLRAAARSMP